MGAIGQALGLVISTLGGFYIGAVVIRFLLQTARADFYNPVTQTLVKLTSPLVVPLRKFIPGYKGFDLASIVLALLLNILATALLTFVYFGAILPVTQLIGWSAIGVVSLVFEIYFWGLIISIVASWIAPMSANPILLLIYQLLEPIQSRFRKLIPPMGGLDITPIFIFLGIRVLKILFVESIAAEMNLNPLLVIGI